MPLQSRLRRDSFPEGEAFALPFGEGAPKGQERSDDYPTHINKENLSWFLS